MIFVYMYTRQELNLRKLRWKRSTLPFCHGCVEHTGIEPVLAVCKTAIRPLDECPKRRAVATRSDSAPCGRAQALR